MLQMELPEKRSKGRQVKIYRWNENTKIVGMTVEDANDCKLEKGNLLWQFLIRDGCLETDFWKSQSCNAKILSQTSASQVQLETLQ